METRAENFANQIEKSATKRLTESHLGMAYVLREQGGVNIAEDDTLRLSTETQVKITNLLGITKLSAQLRRSLFEQSSEGGIVDSSKSNPESRVVPHQDEFVRQLLGQNPKLIDNLAEITAKARVSINILNQQPNDTLKDIKVKIQAWKQTIEEVALGLCSSEAEKAHYQNLVKNNITKLNSPSQRTTRGPDGETKTSIIQSYSSRLDKLIKNHRAGELISSYLKPQQGETLADNVIDEYLETAFTLNATRVLDRIQRPLDFNGKFRKLTSCLEGNESDSNYIQIIKNNGLNEDFLKLKREIEQVYRSSLTDEEKKQRVEKLNNKFKEKCHPIIEKSFIKETDQDEVIDLVDTKEKIADLKKRANEINSSNLSKEEKKQQLLDLDEQMQSLLIPIANKVNRIFPHQDSTNLTDVLEKEDAICAGKVNVLLAISKYLGINGRANTIKEILDNTTIRHVCYECDLPSRAKLVIDTNFSNKRGLEEKTDDELIAFLRKNNPGISDSELESLLRYTRLTAANAQFISTGSRVLIYTTENTGKIATNDEQVQETKKNQNLLIRVNPYTGQKEIWKANIPYPHLVTFPNKDGYLHINSSFANNTAYFITKNYAEIGIYLFKKHIEMSPYDARAYTGLAALLPEEEGTVFLEKIKKTQPAFYWEEISTEHALMYARQDNLEIALQIFGETKAKNPPAYYRKIHELSAYLRNKANKETEEEATKLKSKARELMESARRENPAAFYSNKLNVNELISLCDNQIDKKIEIHEEFRKTQEASFWDASDHKPPFERLAELYLEQSKVDSSARNNALALINEIKTQKVEFYNKKVYLYAFGLYLQKEHRNPESAVAMLEEVKINSPQSFFQEDENVTTLAKLYEEQQDNNKVIALYEESRSANPDLFWNDKYSPIYESLFHFLMKTGKTEKAIAILEEAKIASRQFWEASYSGGYSQLAKLYAEVGKIPEAIAINLEAKTRDPNFLSSKSEPGGYTQLASLYEQNGQINEAINTMLQGQEGDANFWARDYSDPNAFRLADYYEKSGQINQAILTLEKIREKNTNYWKTKYYRVCELYDQSGNHEKAKQVRAELIAIYEELRAADINLFYESTEKLANLYLSEGQIQKAIETLEKGKENFDYFPIRSIITLAELYLQNGDREKAKLTYEDAIRGYKRFKNSGKVQYVIDRARARGIELSNI